MPAFLLALLLICSSAQSIFAKLYTEKARVPKDAAPAVFNIYYSLITAFGALAVGGFVLRPSGLTFLFASVAALSTTVYNIAIVRAAQSGPYPIYMVCALFGGILLPTAVGTAIFGDSLGFTVIAGAVLMLAAIAMLSATGPAGKLNGRFIRSCVALFVSNGSFGTAFALQARYVSPTSDENTEFVFFAFAASALISLVILFARKKKEAAGCLRLDLKGGVCMSLSAAGSCAAQQLNLFVLTLLPSAVVFPVHNGGVLVVVSLFSLVFLKEKMTKIQWAGVAAAAASIVLLSL